MQDRKLPKLEGLVIGTTGMPAGVTVVPGTLAEIAATAAKIADQAPAPAPTPAKLWAVFDGTSLVECESEKSAKDEAIRCARDFPGKLFLAIEVLAAYRTPKPSVEAVPLAIVKGEIVKPF